jgi:Fe-S-cluster containining protein
MIGTIEDMLADMEHGLYDFTKNGKCSQCGGCCSRFLPVTQKEINTIHQYIKEHNIQKADHGVFAFAKPVFDLQCPFLDLTKPKEKCSIYSVRPQICREFICNGTHKCSKDLANKDIDIVDFTEEFFK